MIDNEENGDIANYSSYLFNYSLYASTLKIKSEIDKITCVTINSTTSEKFVSLLRRTASHARDSSSADDKTLIRHAYDLHLIFVTIASQQILKPMVQRVIEIDKKQFGRQHKVFVENANLELRYGLSLLIEQQQHQKNRRNLLGHWFTTLPPPNGMKLSQVFNHLPTAC